MSEHKHNRYRRRPSLVFPAILISLGVVLMLNNFGVLDWNVWQGIWQLWPVLLIAVGVDLLLGRKTWLGSIISFMIVFVLIAAGVWWVGVNGPSTSNDLVFESISHDLDGANSAQVNIEFSFGELNIQSGTDGYELIQADIAIFDFEDLEQEYRVSGDTVIYTLGTDSSFSGIDFNWFGDNRGHRTWDVYLTEEIPLDLSFEFGVGEANIDLSGLMLENLTIDSGVGEATIFLPAEGEFQVDIEHGVGELTLNIPSELPVCLSVDYGIGDASIDSFYDREGDDYYVSPGLAQNDYCVEISIDGGIGEFVIQVID